MVQVPLELIVSVLAVTSADTIHYLDTQTGEIVSVTDPFDDDAPNELLELAVEDARYIPLPGFEEVEAEDIRVRFADAQNEDVRRELARTARGLYAAMEFPLAVRDAGLQAAWDSFHDEALAGLAARWAADKGIGLRQNQQAPQAVQRDEL